jgi:hypothetical protein
MIRYKIILQKSHKFENNLYKYFLLQLITFKIIKNQINE